MGFTVQSSIVSLSLLSLLASDNETDQTETMAMIKSTMAARAAPSSGKFQREPIPILLPATDQDASI